MIEDIVNIIIPSCIDSDGYISPILSKYNPIVLCPYETLNCNYKKIIANEVECSYMLNLDLASKILRDNIKYEVKNVRL